MTAAGVFPPGSELYSTKTQLSLVESLPVPPMGAQSRGHASHLTFVDTNVRYIKYSRTVPRTAVAADCRLLLPQSESQQRFVEEGVFCYYNQQLREESGRLGGGMMMMIEEKEEVVVGEMAMLWERRIADSSGMH